MLFIYRTVAGGKWFQAAKLPGTIAQGSAGKPACQDGFYAIEPYDL